MSAQAIARVLVIGSVLAIALAVGGVLLARHARPPAPPPAPRLPEGDPAFPEAFTASLPRQCLVLSDPTGPGDGPIRALPRGAVVVADPPRDPRDAAAAFAAALAEAGRGELRVRPGSGLSVLTTGPVLEGGADIEVGRLERRGGEVDVEVQYAQGRGSRWRPLAVVPLLLPEGSYRLRVTWRPRDGAGGSTTHTCAFAAPPGLAASRAVRAGEADFQALTDGRCPAPQAGGRHALHLGLRVTNRSNGELTFAPRGVLFQADCLTGPAAGGYPFGGGSDVTALDAPAVSLKPGASLIFLVRGCLDGGPGGATFRGVAGNGDMFLEYKGLGPGRHGIRLEYHQLADGNPRTWVGGVRTEPAEFTVGP